MNVQPLKQTSVILTLCVTTLSDPTSVFVLLDIRVMVETVQVIEICLNGCVIASEFKLIALKHLTIGLCNSIVFFLLLV